MNTLQSLFCPQHISKKTANGLHICIVSETHAFIFVNTDLVQLNLISEMFNIYCLCIAKGSGLCSVLHFSSDSAFSTRLLNSISTFYH